MATSLPYKAEYAKSGRAGCKLCKTPIEKASLRLAAMVQSRFHDGMDAHWFHHGCFFSKQRPASVGDIEDFESLRYDDQEMIKKKIASGGPSAAAGSSATGKGSKKGAGGAVTTPAAFISSDFLVGYAKSAKSMCVACEEYIPKKAIRISMKEYTSQRAILYGAGNGMDRWHHLDCFVKIREEIKFFDTAKNIPGFKDMDKEDQETLIQKLPAISPPKRKLEDAGDNGAPKKKVKTASKGKEDDGDANEAPKKKVKTESKGKDVKDPEEEMIRKQNKLMYKYRDLVEHAKTGLKKAEWIQVLNTNKQTVPEGNPKAILDLVADIMTFGAMKKCADCGNGQFMYKSGVGYQCTGHISEFTKCDYIAEGDVERVPFKIPNDLREHPVFEEYKFKKQKRVIPKHAAPVKGLQTDTSDGPKLNKKPLAGFKFAISGVGSKYQCKMEKKVQEFGGDVRARINAKLAGVITTKEEFDKSSQVVLQAEKYGVPVVSTDFISNLRELNYKLADEMKKCLLGDWVDDLQGRLKTLNQDFEKPKEKRRGGGGIEETTFSSVKLKLKDGAVIDPQSGLDDGPYHVYKEGKLYYNCVLNNTSVEDGKNSFYKIQIIESDSDNAPKSYHVFRGWGRIGTTIGGQQTDEQLSKQDAIDLFCEKYEEKTGNVWGTKFVKKPGRYIAQDIDYGQSEQEQKKLVPSSDTSLLPVPVKSLISLIFDVNIMKQTLMEFELDMEKMPLGKISRKQLLQAYSVLTDSINLRAKETDARKKERLIKDVTNRFYSLIPHNFGIRMPPLLDNDELLKTKIEMLDNLMEIEIAYELLSGGDNEGGEGKSSIDSYYGKLNADIDILEAHSEEFKVIQQYLANTHAPTHSSYSLELEQVFKVERKGENKRYRPFKDLHNRRLLWHGSRVTNFAGIVSQGLRIAPPEAPVTGYMFGKGIYFADMVTKSANYCNTTRENPTGLLLLCEVALGDMYELKQAKDTISKPPKSNHSVKGLGLTEPDPKETHTFSDGVMVPYGKPVKSKAQNSVLLYNEYIVYDVSQVNIKYLLRVNFNYTGRR